MKNTNKKGFTIVELVIVIAVIAILAAVLIPTFASIVKKANLSNDKSFVRNMNTTLAAEVIPQTKFDYAGDAITALNTNGFSEKYIPYSAGFHYGYHLESNTMYLVDDKNEVIYPDSNVNLADLWLIWNNYATDKVAGVTKYVSLVNIEGSTNNYYAEHFAAGTNYTLDLAGHYINTNETLSNVTVVNGVLVSGATGGNGVTTTTAGTATDIVAGTEANRTIVKDKVFNFTTDLRNKVENTKNVTYQNCYFYGWSAEGAGAMASNLTFDGCTFVDATSYIFNIQGDSSTAYEGTLTVQNCTFINCARVFSFPVFVYGEDNPGSIVITGNTFNAVTGSNRGVIQLTHQKALSVTNENKDTWASDVTKGFLNITISDNNFTGIGTSQAGLIILHEGIIKGMASSGTDPNKIIANDAYDSIPLSADNITFSGNKVDSSIPADKYVVNDDGKADNEFDPYKVTNFKAALTTKFNAGK